MFRYWVVSDYVECIYLTTKVFTAVLITFQFNNWAGEGEEDYVT